MASNSTSACAICSKPASNRCSGCKINTYCGRDCQTSDWVKHKAICKIWQIENLLRRVTAITHETYLLFRENTWSSPVTSIEGHGTKDIVFTQVAKHMLRKKYFSEFPHKLTKDEQTKASVLTMGASNEPLGFMCDNLHELLKGLPVLVEEVKVGLRQVPLKTTIVYPHNGLRVPNWPNFSHNFLRIKHAKSKSQWAIDVTGGQFGIFEPFWKWDDYVTRFVETARPMLIYPLGTNKAVLKELSKLEGTHSMKFGVIQDFVKVMKESSSAFEKSQNTELAALLQVSEDDFVQKKKMLLQEIAGAICKYKKSMEKKHIAMYKAAEAYEYKKPNANLNKVHQIMMPIFQQHLQATEKL